MSREQGAGTASAGEPQSETESPSTKLQGEPPAGSPMPGVENPESDTVGKETNPNTE